MFSSGDVIKYLNAQGWRTPSAKIAQWRKKYYEISIHINGVKPNFRDLSTGTYVINSESCPEYDYIFNTFLLNRHPRESQENREWRLSQYNPTQRDCFQRANHVVVAACFQDSGYSIRVSDKREDDYIWGNNFSGTNFINKFSSHSLDIFNDAEGYFLVIPKHKRTETPITNVEPDIRFIHFKNIYYKDDNCIVFSEQKAVGNNSPDVVWMANTVGYFKFNKDKEGKYTLEDDGYYTHLFNTLPIVKAGGLSDGKGGFDSWFIGAKAWADEYVSAKSAELLVNKNASHPFIVATSEECPDCNQGWVEMCTACDKTHSSCTCGSDANINNLRVTGCNSCGGTGKQSRNPGDWMLASKEDMQGDVIKIITPDIKANEHLKKTADDLYQSIMRSLHITHIEQSQSGLAKSKDMETRYQFVLAIANDWFDRLIPQILKYCLMLRNVRVTASKEVIPYAPKFTFVKPTQFSIKSATDLLIDYQISSQAGMPEYVRARQMEDYVDKHFGGDHVQGKMVRLINDNDIFCVSTQAEISASIRDGGATQEDYQWHNQLPMILRKIISEKGEVWFLKTDNSVIIDEAKNKFSYIRINKNTNNGQTEEATTDEVAERGNGYPAGIIDPSSESSRGEGYSQEGI